MDNSSQSEWDLSDFGSTEQLKEEVDNSSINDTSQEVAEGEDDVFEEVEENESLIEEVAQTTNKKITFDELPKTTAKGKKAAPKRKAVTADSTTKKAAKKVVTDPGTAGDSIAPSVKKRKTPTPSAKTKKDINMPEVSIKKKMTVKEMIIHAVGNLKDRKGATIPAIKKRLKEMHDISDQSAAKVSKLLRTAGEEGWLLQVSGNGASSGSRFKLTDETKKTFKRDATTVQKTVKKSVSKDALKNKETKKKTTKKEADK